MGTVLAIFTTALDLIGKDKVGGLLKSLGYESEPTPALCIEVLDREGANFGKPFGQMMLEAAKSPVAKAKFLVAAQRLSKANGSTPNAGGSTPDANGLTAQQKSDMGLAWFEKIGGLLTTGLSSVDDIMNAANGTNAMQAQAQYLYQQRLAEEQQQKKTLYWVIGGIGVLLIVTVFIIALTKRS